MTAHIVGAPIEETAFSLLPAAAAMGTVAIVRMRHLARSLPQARLLRRSEGQSEHRDA